MHPEYTAYISPRCNHCVRFLEILKQSEMKRNVRIIDVDDHYIQGITTVPTVAHVSGKLYNGKSAFDLLGQYKTEISGFELNQGGICYGEINNCNSIAFSQKWSDF